MSGAAADAEHHQHHGPDVGAGGPLPNSDGGGRGPGLSSTAAVGSLRDLLESLRFDMDGQPQAPGAEGMDGDGIPGGVPDEYGGAGGEASYANRVSSDGEGGNIGGRRSSPANGDYDDDDDDDEGQVYGDDDEYIAHRRHGSDDGGEYYREQQHRGRGPRRASRDANITDDEYRYGSGTGGDDDDSPYSDDDDSVASAKSYEDAGYDNEEDYLFDQVSYLASVSAARIAALI